jgi:hypothetical protein
MRHTRQREKMRELYAAMGGDEDRTVAAYAAAERAGVVQRRSNLLGKSPERYARDLFADGRIKGWLT